MKLKASVAILLMNLFQLSSYSQWIKLDSLESAIMDVFLAGNKLFACTATTGVYTSIDSGLNWNTSNVGLTNLNTRVLSVKDDLLVLGTNSGIFKSENFGSSWMIASNGIPNTMVSDILIRADSIIIATYGDGIYLSLDNCQSWYPINNGLIDLYKSCLLINGTRLYVGTQYAGSGIYVSDDNGLNWIPKNNGVPLMPYSTDKLVDITSFTKIGQTIFASTYGCGILKSDDNGENWIQLSVLNTYAWIIFSENETLLTGHSGAGVCRSADFGNSWSFVNEGLQGMFDKEIMTFCTFYKYIFTGSAWSGNIFRRLSSELIVGTQDKIELIKIHIAPNPVALRSKFIGYLSENGDMILLIYNVSGNLIRKINNFQPSLFELSRSDFASGLYFFHFSGSRNKEYYGKFIIE
jgi:hypothetical protein